MLFVTTQFRMGNPAQVSGTLDEAGDHLLWFRVAGRLSTVPPHREKETIIASEICFLTATELVRLVREGAICPGGYGGAPSADRACQP